MGAEVFQNLTVFVENQYTRGCTFIRKTSSVVEGVDFNLKENLFYLYLAAGDISKCIVFKI